MNNKLLIDRLMILKKDEFLRFEAFILSPYFQKNKNAALLIQLLKPFYPEFKMNSITEKKIKQLTPSLTAHHVLISRINDLLDEFSLYERFNKKRYLKDCLHYELELEEKNNIGYYRQLQQQPAHHELSSDDLYAAFQQEFSSIALCENNWHYEKEKIIHHSDLAMSHLMHYFLSKYLMIYLNKMTTAYTISDDSKNNKEAQMILDFIEKNINQQPLSVRCMFYVIQLYKNISAGNPVFDVYYEKIKNEIISLTKEQVTYELKYALLQTSSACVIKCYAEPAYFIPALESVQFLIENKLYFTDLHDRVIQQRFILIVKIALGADETEWAKEFIKNELHYISKPAQNNIYNYALGLIYFNEQKYEEAVKIMVKININTSQFIIDYKITLLKMYYELDDISGFNYQSQTFIKFLSKEKELNKSHKKNVSDSVEFIRLLFKLRKNKSTEKFYEKMESKKIRYLVNNYRDKWYADKIAL